jgi:hypothetical protein
MCLQRSGNICVYHGPFLHYVLSSLPRGSVHREEESNSAGFIKP